MGSDLGDLDMDIEIDYDFADYFDLDIDFNFDGGMQDFVEKMELDDLYTSIEDW